MKKILATIGRAFKSFFISFKKDLKENLNHHKLKLLGYVICFFVPLVYLVTTYIERKPEAWGFPTFVWIPVIMFLIVYWLKIRSYVAIKVEAMKVENNLEKGKHAAAIIVCKTIQVVMTVIPFLLLYYVFDSFSKMSIQIQNIFLFLTVCEAVGGLFIVIDTVVNVVDYSK